MNQASGIAHGKIILIGEHSVVHGHQAIALPFQAVATQVSLEATTSSSQIISDLYTGPASQAPSALAGLTALFNQLRSDFNLTQTHWRMTITSSIPAERGMGSSAAVAGALVRAFFAAAEQPLPDDRLLQYVDFAERINHGNPSGLDARIISLNQPLLYQKDQPMQAIAFATPFWLVIADTGITGNTREAVQAVQAGLHSEFPARQLAVDTALSQLNALTISLHQLLRAPAHNHDTFRQIAAIIQRAHDRLRLVQVSSPELDFGVEACLANGAGAAKLTGGGRGGCYFALVEDKATAEKLAQQLRDDQRAVQTWLVPFSSSFDQV